MHDNDYLAIFAIAKKQAEHFMFVQSYVYRGQIELLIEDTLRETAFEVPADVMRRTTAIDLRDVCMGAAYEVNVEWHRRATFHGV